MGTYEIRVNIEIVERQEPVPRARGHAKEGSFTCSISEAEALSIDKCERALLQTNSEAIREALSRHLTQVSKKRRTSTGQKKS